MDRHREAKNRIRVLAQLLELPPSMHTNGRIWASDRSMSPSDDHGYGKPMGLLGMGLAGVGTGEYI